MYAYNTTPKLTNQERTQLKRQALIDNDHNTYNIISRTIYKAYQEGNDLLGQSLRDAMIQQANKVHPRYLQVVDSLIRSRQRKAKTIKQKIETQLMQGNAYFLTLTFTDDILATTNEETRRKYITRLLKAHSSLYIANVDYGSINGREHYHAVINDPISPNQWPYGFILCKKVGNSESSALKIGKYISKLKNHALKETTNGKSRFRTIIYSRNKNC